MALVTSELDLASMRLTSGEGRRLELHVRLGSLTLGGEAYEADPATVPVALDVSRMVGEAVCAAPAFRCRAGRSVRPVPEARPQASWRSMRARSTAPGEGEELESPYVSGEKLDLESWAHDAFALAGPTKVLCRDDCAGLCPDLRRRPERGAARSQP